MLVMGLSIGYRRKAGMRLEEDKIEHKFLLSEASNREWIEQIYATIPEEYFSFTGSMLERVENRLQCIFNGNLLVHLADHIYSAVQRSREGVKINNALLLDMEQYYPEEYRAAAEMVEEVNRNFGAHLGADEAGFITFHFLEAELELKNALTEIKEITDILNQALKIVKDYFQLEYDTGSLGYARFLIHLKFLAQRVVRHIPVTDSVDEDLLEMIRTKYRREADCARLITAYIREKFDFNPSGFEILYLTIHIVRIQKEGS